MNDTAPIISRLRLRRTPSAGALAPLLDAAGKSPRQGHHLIWSLFADEADRTRDFLWRADGPDGFITLSARWPVDTHRLFHVRSSELFEPALATGDRIGFELHANPVVSQIRDRKPKRMCKHDIITNALRHHPRAERHRLFEQTVQTRGFSWLEAQGRTKGFTVQPQEVTIQGYRRHEIARHDKRGRKPTNHARYATLDFEGVLTVTDRGALLRAIAAGFGSSRTWGCGLMLIQAEPAASRAAA